MSTQRFTSVWDAIEDTVEEAEEMKVRSALMIAVNDRLEEFGWSQTMAAKNLGLTQPRVSDLRRGKVNKFSVEALLGIARKVGLHVELNISAEDSQDD